MKLFGLSITRTRQKSALSPLSLGSGGWWPAFIQERTTGDWQRNETVDLASVLANPTLYACQALIAGDIGKLRPMLVEQSDDGIWDEVESAAFSPVLRKPNHYQTRNSFYESWMLSKLIHGNTYALKARDQRGVVQALYLLDPCRVRPLVGPDGSVFYALQPDALAALVQATVVPAREIIHDVCCPLFHPLVGVSPLYAASFPAQQGLNGRSMSDKFVKNGSRPGGVITVPGQIKQEQLDRIKATWQTKFGGDNVGKIAFLSDGMTFAAPSYVNAHDAQLIEQLKLTDEDIAKIYQMPRHKIGIGGDPTQTNIQALNLQYLTDCLQKHIEKLEVLLDEGLGLTEVPGRTLGVEFELDVLLRMDTKTRVSAALEAIQSGMSPNEVREKYHDLGPVPGGDQPFLQQQNWPVRLLADRSPQALSPAPPAVPMPASPVPAPPVKALDAGRVRRAVLERLSA